jgi:hypothetical protein
MEINSGGMEINSGGMEINSGGMEINFGLDGNKVPYGMNGPHGTDLN